MNGFAPLLAADIGEVIRVLVIILIVVIPALGQWLNRWAQAAAKRKQLPGPAVPPLPGQPPRRPKGAVDAEVEEFLRRAGGRQAEPPRRGEGMAPRPPRPARPEVRRREISRQEPMPRRASLAERAVEVELIEEGHGGESVEEHVKKGVAERSFAQRTAHLADEVVEAEEAMQSHLQEAFGHKVGRLGGEGATPLSTPEAPAESVRREIVETPTTLVGLAALLSDPSQLRHAVVLQEILARPEHRWK
ncbi:MAG: hypothetical protein ACYC35_03920 [Pirellulales bacterium]